MSLRIKFILLFCTLVISIALGIIGAILYFTVMQMEEDANKQYESNLVVKRTLVTNEIVDYFHIIEKQVVTMAHDLTTIDATKAFAKDFKEQQGGTPSNALTDYYKNEYKALFDKRNAKHPIDINPLINKLSPQAINFQNQYIADNPNPLGEKHNLDRGSKENAYNKTHEKYHPSFRYFLNEFGFYDIFIVEPENGNVIYSVFKELDFATSLVNGPYKNSGIAEAFNKALKLSSGEFYLSDFSSYAPSYDAPASFISSPIYENGVLLGVLIYQMPLDIINNMMTQHEEWVKSGFGESGEIYLVGEDYTLRSESRFFWEDKEGYFAVLKEQNIDAWQDISEKGTSILLQPVTSIGAKKALSGETGFDIFKDYRGVEVLSAYSPIDIGGNINWAIMSEIDYEEAHRGVEALTQSILIKAIFVVIAVFIFTIIAAILMANHLISPLKGLSDKVEQLSSGEADLTAVIEPSNIPEIDNIGEGVNLFIKRINIFVSDIKKIIEVFASSGIQLGVTTEQTSKNVEEQTKNTERVVELITALSNSIEEIMQETKSAFKATENANQIADTSTKKSASASNDIRALAEQVQKSTQTIRDLKTQVEDIGDVLTVINSIADQTNLLALNAAIEAARAGEHGRGFSVVADEVRTLASKTQESTVTIQSQIEQLTSATSNAVDSMVSASSSAEHGIELVEFVSNSLVELNNVVKQIEGMNHGISNQTESQSHSIDSISRRMASLQDGAIEISQASSNITDVAGELSIVSEKLKKKTDTFKV